MCDKIKKIVLCSCAKDNKNSRKNKVKKGDIIWYLLRHLPPDNDKIEYAMEGMFIFPENVIEKGALSDTFILKELNSRNCFDFDFIPQDGDNLQVWDGNSPYKYLSFIFCQHEWIIKNDFSFDKKQVFKGKLKFED